MSFRRTARFAPALVALAALALDGCVVLDGRGELIVEPAGTLSGSDRVRLRVRGDCDRVRLDVDGKDLGTWPTAEEVSVPLGVSSGSHTLTVRAWDGALAGSRVEVPVDVDATPFAVASISPGPGVVTQDGPFSVTVRFTNALEASPAPAVGLGAGWPAPGPLARVSLAADRRSVTISSDGSLVAAGALTANLSVWPVGHLEPMQLLLAYRAPAFQVAVTSPPPGTTIANRPVRFVATATGDVPDALELVAGDRVVATLGPPPWDVVLDPGVLGDGTYGFRAPGYRVTGAFPVVVLDTTAPRVVSCGPATSPPDQTAAADCVRVELSEPVVGPLLTDAQLVIGGVAREVTRSALPGAPGVLLCPAAGLPASALPAEQTVALPLLADAAGNALAPVTCPTMRMPVWRSPWGDGAVVDLRATGISLGGTGCTPEYYPDALLTMDGASVRAWTSYANVWSAKASFGARAGATVADLETAVWTERTTDGPGQVRWCGDPTATLNRDASRDARHPSGGAGSSPLVAWSEEDAAGGRVIEVRRRWAPAWLDYGSPSRLAPGSVSDTPVVWDEPAGPLGNAHVAWIETAPGGVPQLRVAARWFSTGTLEIQSGFGNVDPAVAASEPALYATGSSDVAVAWTEGGRVLLRWYDWTDGLLKDAVLNVDLAHEAHGPRFGRSDLTVYWIEQTSAGDEVWGRTLNLQTRTWDLLPGPVNLGAEGAHVRVLDATQSEIAWTDDAGIIRMRSPNF